MAIFGTSKLGAGFLFKEPTFMARGVADVGDVSIEDREEILGRMAGIGALADMIEVGEELLGHLSPGAGVRELEAALLACNSALTLSQAKRAVRLARFKESGHLVVHGRSGNLTLHEAELFCGIRRIDGSLTPEYAA